MKKTKMGVLAATLLIGALALTACGGKSDGGSASSGGASSGGDVVEVKLVASNFEFDQKEIKVKKGQKVKLTFTNKEGMHDIEIPDLKVKAAKAGTAVEFVADKAGTFEYKCGIMCGTGHDGMKGNLIVE